MEEYTDTRDDQPEEVAMDTSNLNKKEMFRAEDLPAIVKMFEKADEGLDIEEFCSAMQELYEDALKEDLIVLHMQIDANCDETVDFGELTDFLLNKNKASGKMDYKNQPFPKPMKILPVKQHKSIVALLFLPYMDGSNPDENSDKQIRTYQRGQYLTVTSNGTLNLWTDSFDTTCTIPLLQERDALPFSHKKKLHVNHMVHLSDLQQVAVCTAGRQLLIYNISPFPELYRLSHYLIAEDSIVNTMNYWSDGTKAVFSFGDVRGFLTMFISHDVKTNGLFWREAYEITSQQDVPAVYVSALLKNPSKDHLCVKVSMFNEICSEIRYFPTLNSIAVCGHSSKTMALVALPKTFTTSVSTKIFRSRRDKEFFTCVGYSVTSERLVTGGTDGLLRVWFPYKTTSCDQELPGHVKSITHIEFNHNDKIFATLSIDNNIRVWSEGDLCCLQSSQVQGMGAIPISTMYYNTCNNELFLANTNIGKYLGRGTDVFRNTLTSHDKPLCSALYHNIFKQVISVCQNGVVTVWDVLTGQAIMEFNVQHVGLTYMTFDGAKRRLITASMDGKVKLWNFNSGTELRVLPATIPQQVTGIVCYNNMLFVSVGKSNIMFELELEGDDIREFEHDCLDAISSMDVYHDTLLIASNNGKIVIWDIEKAKALYGFNIYQNSETQTKARDTAGPTKSTPLTGNRTAMDGVPLIVSLKTRNADVNTTTFLTCVDGYIQAWSMKKKGGLLGTFRAVEDEDAAITAISTDVDDQKLLIGDSTGKIYLWDIHKYGFKDETEKGPCRQRVSLCAPPLLGSWHSHPTRVVSVHYVPRSKSIVTAGLDCNMLLWTDTGCCIGVFGKDYWGATQGSSENADQELKEAGQPVKAETETETKTKKNTETETKTKTNSETKTKTEAQKICYWLPDEIEEELESVKAMLNYKKMSRNKLISGIQKSLWIDPGPKKNKRYTFQSEDGSTACSQETMATTDPPQVMKSSQMTGKSTRAVKVECDQPSEHVSFQPVTDDQGQLEPQPRQTSLIPKKSSTQIKSLKRDTVNGSEGKFTPCPPDIPPGLDLRFPYIPHIPHFTGHKTQNSPQPPQTPLIKSDTKPKQSSPQTESLDWIRPKCSRNQKRDTLNGRNIQFKLCPPDTPPRQDLRLPPIPAQPQLTGNEAQNNPQPLSMPFITGGPDFKKRDAINGSEEKFTPCPPDVPPGQVLRLPPISLRPQLNGNEAQNSPQPPQTQLMRGGTYPEKSPPQVESLKRDTLNVQEGKFTPRPPDTPPGRGLCFPYVPASRKITGHESQNDPRPLPMPFITGGPDFKKRDAINGSEVKFTPCPPDIPPGQVLRLPPIPARPQLTGHEAQNSPQPPKTPLPPIPARPQLTGHEAQYNPHHPHTPLIRSGTDPKKSSPRTESWNRMRKQIRRNFEPQKRDALNGSDGQLRPCPPDIPPRQDLRLLPIRASLTGHKIQLNPRPPQTPSIRGGTDSEKSSPQAVRFKKTSSRSEV